MSLYARVRTDGIEIIRDPADTAGLLPVVENRPALGVDQRYGSYVATVNGSQVTLDYRVENITPNDVNTATLQQRAAAALAANNTYLAIVSPTAAQTTAQARTLTKECNAIIRMLLGLVQDISDTA